MANGDSVALHADYPCHTQIYYEIHENLLFICVATKRLKVFFQNGIAEKNDACATL